MKNCFTFLLILASLCSIASCGDTSTVNTETGNVTTTAVPAETSKFDVLPDADYAGADFTMLIPTELNYEFSEEATGDIVDDAELARDSKIEERYNMNFKYVTEPGNWAGKDTFNGLIRQDVMAGDRSFDVVNGMIAVANLIVTEGLFTDLLSVDGLNFDDPWWAADMDETLAVSGKLFGICGAGQLSMYKSSYIMFYNQKLLDDYDLESPIDLVLDGKWTLDKFLSMTKNVTTDLNSDGKFTAEDQYGYLFDEVTQRGYQTSMELKVIERNADGKLEFVGLTERMANAVDMYQAHISDRSQVWIVGGSEETTAQRVKMFVSDQALFAGETIGKIEMYRNMQSDFGMIPLPKFDETQENYHVQIGTGSGMYFIPITVKDLNMTVDILNAYNCVSMESVVPTYYESAMKDKYLRDEKNAAVLDLINSSMMMDVTFAYASAIGGSPNTIFADTTINDVPIASTMASRKREIPAGIEKLETAFATIES